MSYIVKLLNYKKSIQLIGGKEWRAIASVQFLGGTANAKRIVNKGYKNGHEESYYILENNKIEEIFKFVLTLKGIPKNEWIIDKAIANSGPIGTQE